MAFKIVYSLICVSLLFTEVVPSSVLLYYCTFKDGSSCNTNTPVDETNKILEFENPKGLNIKFTCTSSLAIRWVIHVPLESVIEGTEATVQAEQRGNRSFLTHSLNAHGPLNRLKGTIRCEAYKNSEVHAQVFISTGEKLTLMGNYDAINFFITKSEGPSSIPCAGTTVPKTEKMKLLKTARENKVINSVSDQCLTCICYPFYQCTKPRVCNPSSPECGYFLISGNYWSTAGQLLPESSSADEGLQDWQICAMNYNCSAATVRKYMWKTGRDCNGDGVITCEDYILIHRYGPGGCLNYLDRDGGSKFDQHQTCLQTMIMEEEITAKATYDPTVGFNLNETIDFKALYVCSSTSQGLQYSYAPLDASNEIPSTIQLSYDDDAGRSVIVSCTTETEQLESIRLVIAPCHSLTQCDLKFRPYNDLGKVVGETRSITTREPNSTMVFSQLPFPDGIVGCIGLDGKNGNPFKFVRHFDYFFTDLVSSNIPATAVLKFSATLRNGVQANTSSQTFTCRASTFLALPVFQFAFHYTDGSVQLLPLNATLTQGHLETSYGQLSNVWQHGLEAERSLELAQSPNMTHMSCMVRLINSNEWINETLALPLKQFVTEGSPKLATWTAVAISTLCVVLLISGVYILRLKMKLRSLTEEEIQDFLDGDQTIPVDAGNMENEKSELSIERMGFPQRFRLPPESYTIDGNLELGSGEYGVCYKGYVKQKDQNVPVAIKMLKDSKDKEYFKSFLKEIKVMAYVDEHENVVKFYGAMVERIAERECHVVMEFSPYGNLRSYLSQHTVIFADSPGATSNPLKCSAYSTLQLTQSHLIGFCEQIAAGMEYITKKQVVHGDLAARNVLVFPNYLVKITDFGLARKLYGSGIYSRMSDIPVPWRWMAPESLKSLEFSTASDVWSFGLTTWEIFTQGLVPFSELQSSQELFQFVANGNSLPRPKYATEEMYVQFQHLIFANGWALLASFRMKIQFPNKVLELGEV